MPLVKKLHFCTKAHGMYDRDSILGMHFLQQWSLPLKAIALAFTRQLESII